MMIRHADKNDLESICALHLSAFGDEEGPDVVRLVSDLLTIKTEVPVFSFVIAEDKKIVGHIIFSPTTLEENKNIRMYILAPLAIAKNCQRKGLGKKLIKHSLNELKKENIQRVFVLGDPGFYQQTGFKTEKKILTPYQIDYPAEAWMSQTLNPDDDSTIEGRIQCVAPLMARHYW